MTDFLPWGQDLKKSYNFSLYIYHYQHFSSVEIFLSHSFKVHLTTQWDILSDLDRQLDPDLKWHGAVICVVSPGISRQPGLFCLIGGERGSDLIH